MKKVAIILLGICALYASTPAYAQSGYQVINGTRVFTQVNQAGGYATFSNECGSQTLTQRELQAGAIPNQIIPCPRPSRPQRSEQEETQRKTDEMCDDAVKGLEEALNDECGGIASSISCSVFLATVKLMCPHAGRHNAVRWAEGEIKRINAKRQRESDAKKREEASRQAEQAQADEYYREGAAYETSKQYTQAESAYHRAASHYESAGDSAKQARSLRNAERVACNGSLEEFDRFAMEANRKIDDLVRAAQRTKTSKCSTFPSAVKYLEDKVAERQAESERAARPTIPRNAPPPPVIRREVDVSAPLALQVWRKRQSDKCPEGHTPGRNQTLKCVRKGSAECYASTISCQISDGGCCFNTHNPPLGHEKGHFCCPRGYQCVFAEGPDRGICTKN